MKLALMSLALFVSVSANAKTIDLSNDKNIFEAAAEAFPTAIEQVGNGFSREIYVKSLLCLSNQDEDECTVVTFDDQSIRLHSDDDQNSQAKISKLWKALVKGGVKTKTSHKEVDGIGVTTISLNKFDCARIEPKPSNPNDQIKVRYSSSYEQ